MSLLIESGKRKMLESQLRRLWVTSASMDRNKNVDDFAEVFRELLRFFGLIRNSHYPLAMTSRTIDTLWHEFVLQTEIYSDFCQKHVGFYVHHRRHSSQNPVPLDSIPRTIDILRRNHGPVKDIWFDGISKTEVEAARSGGLPSSQWSGWPGRQ